MNKDIIKKALVRFALVLDSLDCECDVYNSYVCTIHNDKKLINLALKELR